MALAFLRRHRWWFNWFLVLIIASFVYFYIPAFRSGEPGSPGESLTVVGGLPISVGEFERSYLDQRRRLEQMAQRRLDDATLRSFRLEERVLDGLISDRLVRIEAQRLGLSIDDEAVARYIAGMPAFQESGRFVGAAEYRRRLGAQGLNTQDFEASVRTSLLRQRLVELVGDGASDSPAAAEREFRRRSEQIKLEYVLVDAARYRPEVQIGESEVQAQFDAHKEAYRIPEKRVVSYLLVDTRSLESRVSVTDHDIDAYYQEHKEEFRQQEQACASHILVKVKSDSNPDGHPEDAARRLAQGLLDEVNKGGDFAAIARRASEDKGSASRGGDLDCFPRGRMVPEFDQEAFSLSAGQTSGLVRSPFGFHIIRVTSRQEEALLPLARVKDRIRQQVLAQRVQALAEEKAQAIAEALRRGKSLAEAGQPQGFDVQKSVPLARGESLAPLDSQLLVARAFELKAGAVDREPFLVSGGVAFIGLPEVQPSRLPELAQVVERVRADLLEQKAFERAREAAQQLASQAEAQGLEKAATARKLVRKETAGLVSRGQPLGDLGVGQALEDVAYALPEKTLSQPVRVAAGYAILRVLDKKPFDPVEFEKQKVGLMASLREELSNQMFEAYLSQVRERVPIERNVEALRRVTAR